MEKNNIIGIYFKADTNESIKSPKIVQVLDQMHENKSSSIEYFITAPENPGFYELGVFITNSYGELLGLYAIDVEVIP